MTKKKKREKKNETECSGYGRLGCHEGGFFLDDCAEAKCYEKKKTLERPRLKTFIIDSLSWSKPLRFCQLSQKPVDKKIATTLANFRGRLSNEHGGNSMILIWTCEGAPVGFAELWSSVLLGIVLIAGSAKWTIIIKWWGLAWDWQHRTEVFAWQRRKRGEREQQQELVFAASGYKRADALNICMEYIGFCCWFLWHLFSVTGNVKHINRSLTTVSFNSQKNFSFWLLQRSSFFENAPFQQIPIRSKSFILSCR